MIRRRKILSVFVVVFLTSLLSVQINQAECKEKIAIRLAMQMTGDNGWGEGLRVFKRRAEEISNKQVEVAIYYGTLGGSLKIIETVQTGSIQGGTLSPLTGFVPEIGILDLPWLFTSWDHSELTIDGVIGKWLEQKAYERGFKILGWYEFGARDLSNRVRPIRTPADVKGLKIRVMQSPEFVALYKAYGAIPVPMAPAEVYTGLQQGVIDGIETSLGAAYELKVHEVAKYGASLGEVLAQTPFAVNAKWFDSLPEDIRWALLQAGLESTWASRRRDQRDRELGIEKWKKAGCVVTFPDKTAFMEIGRSILPQFYDKVGGKKYVEWILDSGEGLKDGLK